ncbi:MAG: hypothetical protein A2X13_03170 [Bacteroidetes bacterium GWC2_33_15]|nr:MAG: hypothetical protein A2X10_09705 [Bacteroidetes bacterium GWA2_33_15]OFX49545.1 MAG: hypothetical protein A2X13_03170 [Bacteroidetes bacterium GWC2_33_15]OFX63616.1 MAG: hypothetical protein A2X15_01055 [Bacteroidetes bacterium GWB2_32_14]OFX68830.1 MAG: hypothetical protein A2X14_13050 [Bacteroidetes bacterium GWD2_33_33]HAN17576.1 hypothetical protein [Bacteroidales bacterium]
MNGSMYQKSLSKTFQTNTLSTVLEILFLLLLGISAVMLRSYLRIPLNIPGRHGLEFMAILIIGRRVSKIPFASVIAMVGASSIMFVPFIGIKDPFLPVTYLLMGIVLDSLYFVFRNPSNRLAILTLIGGLTYMVIPISRLGIYMFTGIMESSFIKWGFVIPIASHFVFGLAGALLGAGLVYSIKRLRK